MTFRDDTNHRSAFFEPTGAPLNDAYGGLPVPSSFGPFLLSAAGRARAFAAVSQEASSRAGPDEPVHGEARIIRPGIATTIRPPGG